MVSIHSYTGTAFSCLNHKQDGHWFLYAMCVIMFTVHDSIESCSERNVMNTNYELPSYVVNRDDPWLSIMELSDMFNVNDNTMRAIIKHALKTSKNGKHVVRMRNVNGRLLFNPYALESYVNEYEHHAYME